MKLKLRNSPNIFFLVVSYLVMWVVIFGLPFLTAEGYSILENTTSQLGAQHTPNSWIMNLVFILLGVSSLISGWNIKHTNITQRALLTVFCLSLIATAFFSHAPINTELSYDIQADELHSLFASITGMSFTFFAISRSIYSKNNIQRKLALGVAILSTVLSLLMFSVTDFMGIWQRLIFIISFGWLIYEFNFNQYET